MDKMQEILNSPDAMDKVLNIAKNLMGDAQTPESEQTSDMPKNDDMLNILGNVDPKVLQTVMGVMSEYNSTDDRRLQLLNALRPYMKSDDAGHIDKAVQIMRLSKVVKSVFKQNLGGGSNV